MRKMVDSRIRNLIDMYYGQVVNLHHILSKTVKKSRPTVLSFYKNKLELGSHRKKRAKQVKRIIQSGLYDPVSLFLETVELTYCSYKDSERILGNTYGMGIRPDSEGPSEAEKKLKYLKEELVDAFPAGPLVKKCCTLEQGTAVMTLLNLILDKTSKGTRGSGKSDALGLAIAGAVATGYSNIFVTATSPENLKTLFDFVCKGLDALDYKEHIDFDVVRSSNPEFKKATVRINIYKQHRQTIQYIQPHEHEKLSQVELLVIDKAVAIPLPVVKSLLGPHLIFLSSTINSYEGTDRLLSLELIEQLEQQSQTSATVACRCSITHLGRLIRTKSRQGILELEEAFDYFNSMIQMQPMPSIWAFNHLLGALYKMNHHIIVVTMYKEMMALSGFHFQPDIRTMNMVIRCLCQLKRIDLCFSVLATAIKRGLKPDACTLNTLLHGLCTTEGSMDEAFELFSKMVDVEQTCDKITYGTMINGFCKAGETWKAVELLKHMYNYERIKLKPDAGCYCPIIHSLSKEGRVDEALSFCEDMLTHDVRPNVVVCNSLIYGLLESGRCEQAMEFLQTMPIWEVSPNIVTYNTMLNALCKEKRIMEALDLVEEMSKRGLKPDCISYNCLISGFCRFGQWRKAMNLLHEMECRGVMPSAITFNIIVDALSKEGNIKEALNVFDLMTRRGVKPDIFTYSILLYGLSHAGLWKETSKLLDEMVSLESFPQTITMNGILDAYSERGNMNIAEKLFDGMIQHGLKPDTITYNILLKGYGLLGKMDKARRLFEQMSSKGVEPDIFSYNALVIGYIKIDRIPAALELLEDVTRKGLAPDDVTRDCLKTIQARSFVANVHQTL